MDKFDANRDGSLNHAEVMELCISITSEVAPNIGVTDADVDMVMRVGGETAKPEITAKDLPAALSAVLALKSENLALHELFVKYDTDHSGSLPKDQLSNLLQELNDGILPQSDDLDFILQQCDVSGEGAINEHEIKAAIIAWYCLTDENLPTSIEEARAHGYTDEQIADYQEFEAVTKGESKNDFGEGKEASEGKDDKEEK